mgnify:CR=1 FL=1
MPAFLLYMAVSPLNKSKGVGFMQQQRFQDCFSTTFSTYPSMLNYHEMQSQTSLWTRCPVKELYVEPLDLASLLAAEDGFAPGISKEALYDTMENLGLAIRVNGAYYPVRETAYRSLLGRAKIGGTALPKLEKQKLADVLNNCLRLFKQDALVLVRDEKVSAVHSGDDADYSVLPIDELLNVLQTKLDERFPGNVFKEGYSDHSVTSAMWELPDQKKELLGTYSKMLSAMGRAADAEKLIRRIRFTPADTGIASAKVSAFLLAGISPIHIGGCVAVDHRNHSRVEKFEKLLDSLFAQFGDSVKRLQGLLQIWLSYPVNAMTRICKKLCLPKKAATEAIKMFEDSTGNGPATAHDVFMALQEVLFNLKTAKAPQSKILLVEENIAKTLSMDWEEYDLAKAVDY